MYKDKQIGQAERLFVWLVSKGRKWRGYQKPNNLLRRKTK